MSIETTSIHEKSYQASRQIIKSLKAKADAKRTWSEKAADMMTQLCGRFEFLFLNCLWFFLWIWINLGFFPSIPPFDPFPFGLLTMIVSLEAIILAIFVLISQNRAAKTDDLREEIDLQIDIITEQELTKLMEIVVLIAKKQGIDISHDKQLQRMLKPTDTSKLEKALEKQM